MDYARSKIAIFALLLAVILLMLGWMATKKKLSQLQRQR